MKIAFFSDIHSNFPALCETLSRMKKRGVEKIFFAGDAVGIGPNPVEVIKMLKEKNIPSIAGNTDRKIVNILEKKKNLKKILKDKNKAGLAWTAMRLGEDEKEWLKNLPAEITETIEGINFLIVHGSPLSDSDYIYPSITPFGIKSKLNDRKTDVLVCGHSHIPFIKVVGNVRVLNCGSAGKPIDGDPSGSFIVVSIPKPGRFNAEIIRFKYNTKNLIKDIDERKVPGVSADEFIKAVKK